MNRYLGPEFPQIISKDNVEYKQANLTVPGWFMPFFPFFFFWTCLTLPAAIVSSAFDPPDGQEPYSIVFDLTGDVAHDRPEKVRSSPVFVSGTEVSCQTWCSLLKVQINHTCNVARLIGEEAARRNVRAYVRLQQPWYECSDKGLHDEKEDVKPHGVIGTWWHESLRILGAIEGCVWSFYVTAAHDSFISLNLVIMRIGLVYGPYIDFGLSRYLTLLPSSYLT
jgi:hypothetical protein